MKRIAFINQRYGLEVNGGSEYYTRLIAEHLHGEQDVEVEILTTKAIDYVTWANYYKADEEVINNITVRRFPVTHERNMEQFGKINAKILSNPNHTDEDEMKWIDAQGPVCPSLIQYIKDNKDNYDVFVFVTYLYYTTCMGIVGVPEKSVLIPTAHDEPYIYFRYYEKVFHAPKAIIYLTDEEKKFVQKKFNNENIKNDVMAVGIDVPDKVDAQKFIRERNIDNFIIYVGRIDESKGCKQLFQYFLEYKKRNKNNLKLVLMGKPVMEIPISDDIISLGFVSEEEKFNGIAASKALILPSEFESLSISVLEAMAISVPVIVNGKCEVLKGHCVKSNAGLYYKNYFEFESVTNYMNENEDVMKVMRINAKKYIDNGFQWKIIINKMLNILLNI